MKLCVLNGSPKGNASVTVQYIKYIINNFQEHTFQVINISAAIVKLEKNSDYFRKILSDISAADVIVWATPVHILFVPGNYKRFIEIIFERNKEELFRKKYSISLTSSIHFYDHIVHNYLHGISDDLDMKYLGFFSADMNDLLEKNERQKLIKFMKNTFCRIDSKLPIQKVYNPIKLQHFNYNPSHDSLEKYDVNNKKIVLITDQKETDNLAKMTTQLMSYFSNTIEVVNLHDINIKGGCLGCCNCAYDNTCVYKDDFVDIYNNVICKADMLICAGNIKDRYLSAKWKLFFDRSFFKGHSPSLLGKQLVWLISGPLSQLSNLREKLISYAEFQRVNLVDIVTDELSESKILDELIYSLAQRLSWASENNYIMSKTFLGVGGAKVFRDEVWGRFRFPFYADYESYKKLGYYDFPQKKIQVRLINTLILLLCKIPSIRQNIFKKSKQYMINPFKDIV